MTVTRKVALDKSAGKIPTNVNLFQVQRQRAAQEQHHSQQRSSHRPPLWELLNHKTAIQRTAHFTSCYWKTPSLISSQSESLAPSASVTAHLCDGYLHHGASLPATSSAGEPQQRGAWEYNELQSFKLLKSVARLEKGALLIFLVRNTAREQARRLLSRCIPH